MLANVRAVRPLFRYTRHDTALEYAGDDMTEVLVFELWRKLHNMRNITSRQL